MLVCAPKAEIPRAVHGAITDIAFIKENVDQTVDIWALSVEPIAS